VIALSLRRWGFLGNARSARYTHRLPLGSSTGTRTWTGSVIGASNISFQGGLGLVSLLPLPLAILFGTIGFGIIPAIESAGSFSHYREKDACTFSKVILFFRVREEATLAPRGFFVICVVALGQALKQATVARERNLTLPFSTENAVCV
jgi:hypothetical protein